MERLTRFIQNRRDAHQIEVVSHPANTPDNENSGPVYSKTRVVPVSPETLLRNRIIVDEKDPVADQFKLLRTLIFNRTRPQCMNTIQVTGFGDSEGKSLVAANLAVNIARDSRQTTLLVDLNFRNPSIHSIFGLDESLPGLISYFTDGTPIEELLINPGIGGLTILPAGGKLIQAPELIGSLKMEVLVRELKERYKDRYIIFDTPSLDGYPDSLVFSEYIESVIIVARAGFTSRTSINNAAQLIPQHKVLGVVFNGVAPTVAAFKQRSRTLRPSAGSIQFPG